MSTDFEKKHFRHPCYWVGDLSLDVVKSELKLSLVSNPETSHIDAVITFYGITNYGGEFDLEEYEEDCMQALIGLDDYKQGEGTKYCINFQVGEIIFITKLEPAVCWNPK